MTLTKQLFILSLFGMLAMFACSHLSGMKSTRAYVAALEELTTLSESYQASYANASDEAKAKWDDEITPLFLEADEIMDTWSLLLDMNADTDNVQKVYLELRSLIIKSMLEIEKG